MVILSLKKDIKVAMSTLWGGCSPTLMAGTHGYGFGYFMEIEKMIIEEQKPELIYQGGCDLTYMNPVLMDVSSCLKARYDGGIGNHLKERTGVIEIWRI